MFSIFRGSNYTAVNIFAQAGQNCPKAPNRVNNSRKSALKPIAINTPLTVTIASRLLPSFTSLYILLISAWVQGPQYQLDWGAELLLAVH